ncbi:MAG: response regulator [Microbacteriaceae bacterium]
MGAANRRAVVVDDEPLICSIISEILEAEGWEVTRAHDALAALTAVQESTPALIVADIDLGIGPTGIDVVQRVRVDFPEIAVVFITNLADPRITGKGWDTIPQDASYIVKTELNSTNALREAVSSALESGNALRHMVEHVPVRALSNLQLAVLKLVSDGMTNEQIAAERGTSVRAVERMISRMIEAAEIPAGPGARVQLARLYWDELNGR